MTSVRDIIIVAIILLAVGVCIATVVYMSHTVNTGFINSGDVISNNTKAVEVINASDDALNFMDYIYFVGFLAFFIAIVVTSWFSASHPIFSVIYFIIVILFTFFSVILQYVWTTIAANPFYIAALVDLPITNYILTHIAYFIAVFGLIGLLLMFAKSSSESGVQ